MQIASGDSIKKFRKQKGYTQKQLAEKAGISRTALIRYENGETSPSIQILQQIAAALDVSVSDIFPLAMAVEKVSNAIVKQSIAKKSNEMLCIAFKVFLNNKNIDSYDCSDIKLVQLFAEFLEEQRQIECNLSNKE